MNTTSDPGTADEKLQAVWSLSLDFECPNCKDSVDLLDYPDFWDGRDLGVCENSTEKSRNVSVQCPECDHEFVVDLEY